MNMSEPGGPRLRDSDLVYLGIRRMERVAEKMQKLEYDSELEQHMNDASEWMEYLMRLIKWREGQRHE